MTSQHFHQKKIIIKFALSHDGMYYMSLATHAFHCSLCVSLFMSTQAHVQLGGCVVQRWTLLKKGHGFLQTWLAIWNTLFGNMLSYVAKFALNFSLINFLSLRWFFFVCKFFHLFELENLCVNCTKEKKTLYTDFILISHFILRFGETSVQFGGTLQITLMLG
jgi:hypothetical protein